jgi:serine phosphatase RsbU (regulator of sigma subunit)
MRTLVGWDDPTEAETIGLYLNVDGNEAQVTVSADEFLREAVDSTWDVVLLALGFPSKDESLALFERVRGLQAGAPIVGACRPGEIFQLSQFLTRGLHSYITRDAGAEFIFLLTQTVESAHAAAAAERSRILAERLRQEVNSVRRLQESVIPRDLPRPPGYEVAASYEPSQIQVLGTQPVVLAGGDYYDVFTLDEHKLVFLVGDASGHGMKACMSIMTMHTLIRMIREQRYQNTADFVAEVNRRLCENNIIQDEGGFITLLYCALDMSNHTLQWTAAGHPMPLLHDLGRNEVRIMADEEQNGLPLGISPNVPYEVCTAAVPENSRVLLYTDGLAEAFPESAGMHAQFGLDGIMSALRAAARLHVTEALDMLFLASNAFTGGSGRHDDTSAVLLERKHPSA